jgi:hypothetical protein
MSLAVVGGLVGMGVWGWMLGQRPSWNVAYVPARPAELRGFNRVDDRLARFVSHAELQHALVLVNGCPHWECYGSVFWRNSPDLAGEVVYARRPSEGGELVKLLAAFPDRLVYVADYSAQSLTTYGTDAPPGTGLEPGAEAPLASDVLAEVNK